MAVVSFVPLVHGVVRGLHPLLLEELLELGQAHVGVLLLQAGQVELLEGREGGFHAALGVPVQLVGNAAGGKKETRHQQGRTNSTSSSQNSATACPALLPPSEEPREHRKKAGDKAGSPLPAPRDVGAGLGLAAGRERC